MRKALKASDSCASYSRCADEMLRIIFVGGSSQPFKEVEEYFLKRLSGISGVLRSEIHEIPASKAESVERRLKEEANRIKNLLKGRIFVTDPNGMLVSDEFMLNLVRDAIYEDISVVVGGAFGVSPEIKGTRISFSRLTFTHELFRVMLLEQIYRQVLTIKGVKYKK